MEMESTVLPTAAMPELSSGAEVGLHRALRILSVGMKMKRAGSERLHRLSAPW